jgi:AraC family transcriptional regulator, regulatory protein of adaptative response / DNA-3-methyladenine glycosylase II
MFDSMFNHFDVRALDRARISRDARFDGKFFIAVKTTGIYCRPICPSRTSNSRNVSYYPTAAAAAEAGFRPCLRCRPEAAPGTPAWMGTSAVVRRALRLIDEGMLDNASVDELASKLGLGSRHLRRLFLQHVGASPISFAQTRRLQFAKRLLDETNLPITQIALASGFGSLRRFNTAFLQTYGRAPRDLRKHLNEGNDADGEVILKLAFRPPYDWKQVHDFLLGHHTPGVERIDEQGYSRTLRTQDGFSVVNVKPLLNEAAFELRVSGAAPTSLFNISSAARSVFDASADPALTMFALRTDPLIGPGVEQRPGLRIPGEWDPFECAVRAILREEGQDSAQTLMAHVVDRFGEKVNKYGLALTSLFPTPSAIADGNFAGLCISRSRINTLRKLAQAVVDRAMDFSAPSECVIEALTKVPGIDRSMAEYVALRALGEPDAFPSNDLVLRLMASNTDRPLSAEQLEARSEAWRPWRGYAALHLWCATESRS